MHRAAVALLAVGLSSRVWALLFGDVAADGSAYATMASSFLKTGQFTMPMGEWFLSSWEPSFSHHYGPLYPLFLVPFVAVGGLNPTTVKAAAFASGLLLMVTVYLTTRSLYGARKSVLATAAVSIDPVLVLTVRSGYSENFLTVLFVLTVWAILKSLTDPRFMVLAGLFAGLTYLTKGVMGWFFILGGLGGLAWRFHFMGWNVFKDRYYLAAIAIFGSFVLGWSGRNLAHFWDGKPEGLLTAWQSSEFFSLAAQRAAAAPADLLFILAVRVPLFVGLFLLSAGVWEKELRRLPKISDEHYSGLWLAVGLTYLLAWIISGIFWTVERAPLYWIDIARYTVIAGPALLWIVLRDANIDAKAFGRKFAAMAGGFLLVLVVVLAQPQQPIFGAYAALRTEAPAGSVIAVDQLNRYEVLVNVGDNHTFVKFVPGVRADYVVTPDVDLVVPGYQRIYAGHTTPTALTPSYDAAVWKRA